MTTIRSSTTVRARAGSGRTRRALAPAGTLLLAALASGCGTLGKEVESLEPTTWESDEGVVVMRIFTARADDDDLEQQEHDPDFDYSLSVSSSKSILLGDFSSKGGVSVEGKDGPALIVRRLDGGDYYFNEVAAGGGTAPMAVKFSVQPGRVTYVGDLHVLFIEGDGFLGLGGTLSCAYVVDADLAAVRSALQARFPRMPEVTLVPMVVEQPSF